MSKKADWTPFCVPWTWTQERCLYWRCPQPILITCVIDDIQDTDPWIACVIHRDKQLGFRAIPNDMSRARKFIGLHLVDIARRDPASSSPITFYLTRGPCPCERQLLPPAQQARQRQQSTKGQSSDCQKEGCNDGEDEGVEAEANWVSRRRDAAATTAGRDFMGGGCARSNGDGAARFMGRGDSSRNGVAGATAGAGPGQQGPVVARQGRCRCPCHARHLTKVLVSLEQAEEMEGRRGEQPFGKQQGKWGSGGPDRGAGRAAGSGLKAEAAVAVAARANVTAAARLAPLRPAPRMSAAPRETVNSDSPSRQRSRASPPRLATNYLPRDIAAAAEPRAKVAAASGAIGTTATAAAAAAAPSLERLSNSQRSYQYLGPSKCTVPANSERSTIASSIVHKHFLGHDRVLVAVEVDGVLQSTQKPYTSCRVTSYMCHGHPGYRIFPTPPLAVGKLCVGWGLMPENKVLVMQVVSDLTCRGVARGSVRPQHRQDDGARGRGSGQAEPRKRTAADAGLEERRPTRLSSVGAMGTSLSPSSHAHKAD
ncbi:hypothetical protein Vretimale_7791 [Volvox reticuliferus]|uniref:Uncharacterized protein n=1 Tax=Volvox reticuliferus TaxID=1737510 RepID=A0A8J4C424_9CHLO|nr:hypothetical protein Vretifemale_4956 [Volvox reticuliferus]GIM02979.1 hypothetical protein Vretimale_7791 [Volvox reticuliferus]